MIRSSLGAVALCASVVAYSVAHAGPAAGPAVSAADQAAVAAVTQLTTRFAQATREFDAATLRAITADDYLEISPAGELDEREKMLGFYAPEKKVAPPPVETEIEQTRVYGDVALQSVKYTYTMPAPAPGAEPRRFAIRGTLVAHKRKGEWKMVSAHYTGVRPARPN